MHYLDYVDSARAACVPMSLLLKPIFNMAHGCPGARAWKEALMHVQQTADCDKLRNAISLFNNVCI